MQIRTAVVMLFMAPTSILLMRKREADQLIEATIHRGLRDGGRRLLEMRSHSERYIDFHWLFAATNGKAIDEDVTPLSLTLVYLP